MIEWIKLITALLLVVPASEKVVRSVLAWKRRRTAARHQTTVAATPATSTATVWSLLFVLFNMLALAYATFVFIWFMFYQKSLPPTRGDVALIGMMVAVYVTSYQALKSLW